MKVLSKLFLCFTFVALVGTMVTVNADFKLAKDDPYIKSQTEETVSSLVGGVATLHQTTLTTYNGGDKSKVDTHKTSWVEITGGITSTDLRVVQYSYGSSYMWKGHKPTEIAAQYEKDHPGWIVVAGTNGDFFHIGDNCEPFAVAVQEGDVVKSSIHTEQDHMPLGFKDDGTTIYGVATLTNNEYVQILKDGEYKDVTEIVKIDGTPSATGVTLLTRYALTNSPNKDVPVNADFSYDLTGYTIYTITYSLERYTRDNKKVFVKGVISDIANDIKTLHLNDAESASYLVCKDGSLSSLELGDEIRCQCNLTGDWADVKNVVNAYDKILTKGEVIDWCSVTDGNLVNLSYVNCAKNRTVMGIKADGTPIMMVVEKSSYGASYNECAEILKSVGCVEGYLFDGGGSSCIFVRTDEGKFQTINKQEDGNERSDANAMLLVMRDPGFDISVEAGRFEAKVVLNETYADNYKLLSNIKVTVNGVTKDYVSGGVTFTGLTEETKYAVTVNATMPGYDNPSKQVATGAQSSFETKGFEAPDVEFVVKNISKTSVTVEKNTSLPGADWVKDVSIDIGGTIFSMGSKSSMVCGDLLDDTQYAVNITYVIDDPDSSNDYPGTYKTINIKTLSYELPVIDKFAEYKNENGVLQLEYKYTDDDSAVTKAYILCNGEETVITKISGKQKFEGLDFVNTDYTFKFVLEYADGKVESEEIKYTHTGKQENPDEKPDVNPTPTPTPETKKKCGKKSAELVMSLIGVTTALAFILRKRH